MKAKYGFGKQIDLLFGPALERVTTELQKESLFVPTDIDVAATLKKKLNADMPPYRILGACNPPLAHQATGGGAFHRTIRIRMTQHLARSRYPVTRARCVEDCGSLSRNLIWVRS